MSYSVKGAGTRYLVSVGMTVQSSITQLAGIVCGSIVCSVLMAIWCPVMWAQAQMPQPAPLPEAPQAQTHRRVLDKQFVIWQGVESAGLILDGVSTVRGWSRGCYEAGSPFVQTGHRLQVVRQLAIEKAALLVFDYFTKRAGHGDWAWRLPGGMIAAIHGAAGVNNIREGCW